MSASTTSTTSEGPCERTYWVSVLLLFAAGCSVALHIGKAPPALPVLREMWDLSLTRTGMVISIYTLLIALLGIPLGLLVRQFGNVRFAVAGIAMAGIGSMLGADAGSLNTLLLTRALEGFGWIVTVVSLPSILTSLSASRDRPLVLGIWGAFVPVGAGAMLLIAPTMQTRSGWPLSWQVAGVASLAAAILVLLITRRHAKPLTVLAANKSKRQTGRLDDIAKPAVWCMGLCFFVYSFQYTPVVSFLPTLFLESSALSLATLSYLTAVVILSNTIGNVSAGILLRRGISYQMLMSLGFLVMGCATLVIYLDAMPFPLRLLAAAVFSAVSGLIPGTLFALVPRVIGSPEGAAPVIGLMLQLSGVAQLIGAVLLPYAVEVSGCWFAAGVVTSFASCAGLLLVRLIRLR